MKRRKTLLLDPQSLLVAILVIITYRCYVTVGKIAHRQIHLSTMFDSETFFANRARQYCGVLLLEVSQFCPVYEDKSKRSLPFCRFVTLPAIFLRLHPMNLDTYW